MDYLKEFTIYSVILRLLLAMLTGGIIGYGRSKKNRNAGLRTYMLTCIGAALTILLSIYEYEMLQSVWAPIVEEIGLKFDASRFSASVISGIGFLAAGTIIGISHKQVSGLTTATGLFASVCMGIACGAGFYELVILALIGIIIAMELMSPLEIRFKRRIRNLTLYVEFANIHDMSLITDTIKKQNAKIYEIDIEHTEHVGNIYPSAIFTLKLDHSNSHTEMLSTLAELQCVYSVQELFS